MQCDEGAVELCATMLQTCLQRKSNSNELDHVVGTICNLACVQCAESQFEDNPVVAGLLQVCCQKPSPGLLESVLSAIWVLLPQQRPMEVFIAHNGLETVLNVTDGIRNTNTLLALIGIIRVLVLSSAGLAEVKASAAPRRVVDVLKLAATYDLLSVTRSLVGGKWSFN